MTSQEPQTPISVDAAAILDTEVIAVAQPSPVFVDSTGRRRRVLRRVAYGFGALCMLYGGLVSVSLAGGPVSSSVVLPLPDLADGDRDSGETVVARPTPTPEPITATPSRRPVLEVLPRRNAPVTGHSAESRTLRRSTNPTARPARSAAPEPTTKKPASSPSKPRPAESGTTRPATPTPTKPATDDPVTPPVPPVPPGTGGEGGGTPVTTDGNTGGSGSGGGGGTSGSPSGGEGGGTGGGGGGSPSGGEGGGGGETGGEGGETGGEGGETGGSTGGEPDAAPSDDSGSSKEAPETTDPDQPTPTAEASL